MNTTAVISNTVTCSKCGHTNQVSAMNCVYCNINLAWATDNLGPAEVSAINPITTELELEAATKQTKSQDVAKMYKEIRAFAIFSLLMGSLSIFASGTFDPFWGLLMIVIAFLSWKVKVPAMFVVYSVVMGWAAISNLLGIFWGAESWWLILAIMQIYWTFSLLKTYRKYRNLPLHELHQNGDWPVDLPAPQDERKISSRFAIAGALLAGVSFFLLPGICIGEVLIQSQQPTLLTAETIPIFIYIPILAFSLSCAALLSKTEKEGFAIGGVVLSGMQLFTLLVGALLVSTQLLT